MMAYSRVTPVITVGHTNDVGMSIQYGPISPPDTGDFLFDDGSGSLSVWSGTGWDMIGGFRDLAFASGAAAKSLEDFSQIWESPKWEVEREVALGGHAACPYCATLNPPDAAECGEGRWNGCGAPLREQ